MKIIKCYIENFGKLQNFEYEFQDGLNTIKEENGFGKTTLAAFIKAMFYGLDASRSEKSERKRYKPWQGGNFGGNIEFEVNNTIYRVERFFGSKAADDTFKIYNLSSNLESNDFTENIGEEIFKINKEGYERSTFIPQGGIQIEMEDSINAKLGNVLESESDVNTSDNAIKILSDAMKIYVKIGNKGLLNERKSKLNELERNLEESKTDEITLEAKKKRLEEIKQKIEQLEKERKEKHEELSKKIEFGRKQAKLETYNNILNKVKEEQEKYNVLFEFFKKGIPEDECLQELSNKILDIEKIKVEIDNCDLSEEEKSSYESLYNKFYGKNITEEDINNQIMNSSKIKEYEATIQSKKNENQNLDKDISIIEAKNKEHMKDANIIMWSSIVMVLVGFALTIFGIYIGTAPGIIGILGLTFATIKLKNKKFNDEIAIYNEEREKNKREIEKLEEDIRDAQKKMSELINKFNEEPAFDNKLMILTNLKTAINNYKLLENKKSNKENYKEQLNIKKRNIENEVIGFLKRYFDDIEPFTKKIEIIKIKKNELTIAKGELEKALVLKEEFEKNNNMEDIKKVEKYGNENEKDFSIIINELSTNIDKLIDEKNQIKNQIEVLENKIDENEYIETDIDKIKEQISDIEKRYHTLEKTKEYLEEAKISFSSSYLKGMVEGFQKYLKQIDDKDFITSVDTNLDVKFDVNGSKKEIKYFSAGYKDLIYICMRFSLVRALFKEELPFVILDDPFVNLDEKKTKKALKLLNSLAEEYQIIYFVCNKSRS